MQYVVFFLLWRLNKLITIIKYLDNNYEVLILNIFFPNKCWEYYYKKTYIFMASMLANTQT
jgi:hypothetical protein